MAAEVTATLYTLTALNAAVQMLQDMIDPVDVVLIIDNENMVRLLSQLWNNDNPYKCPWRVAAWVECNKLINTLPIAGIHWVPAHGRHTYWKPPPGHGNAQDWRKLNNLADTAASEAINIAILKDEANFYERGDVHVWGEQALLCHMQECNMFWQCQPYRCKDKLLIQSWSKSKRPSIVPKPPSFATHCNTVFEHTPGSTPKTPSH